MKNHRKMQSVALAALMLAVAGVPAHAQMTQPAYGQSTYGAQSAGMAQPRATGAQPNYAAQTSYQPQNATGMQEASDADVARPIQPVNEGGITYVSGGIGDGEEETLKSMAHDYDLQITNTNPQGHFTADTNLVIEGRNGQELVRATNAGPLFYAQLPAGTYTVKAWSDEGQQTVRHVHISGHKPVDMHFVWQES